MELLGRYRRSSFALALFIAAAVAATGCESPPPAESEAVSSFKKEIRETGDRLAPVLMDSLAKRDHRLARKTLRTICAAADKSGTPYSCGITVLDKSGITLASATPAAPVKRLNYSRYEAVMSVLTEKKAVNTILYLQDHTRLFVVGIPMLREGELLGVLVLTFDSNDLQKRTGLTEQEFRDLKLN